MKLNLSEKIEGLKGDFHTTQRYADQLALLLGHMTQYISKELAGGWAIELSKTGSVELQPKDLAQLKREIEGCKILQDQQTPLITNLVAYQIISRINKALKPEPVPELTEV